MFGCDPLMMGAVDVQTYRYLRLVWPDSAGWAGDVGLANVLFYVNSATYPPIMTSNTAPAPYAASAASYYEEFWGTYPPFCAFAGGTNEYVARGNGAGYLQLDFGAGRGISPDRVDLRPRANGSGPASPLTLYGATDGGPLVSVASFVFESWTAGVTKSFATGLPGVFTTV